MGNMRTRKVKACVRHVVMVNIKIVQVNQSVKVVGHAQLGKREAYAMDPQDRAYARAVAKANINPQTHLPAQHVYYVMRENMVIQAN